MSVWDETIGGRPKESYQEALARSLVGKPEAPMTEQELAAKLVADRDRMRRMDELFRDNFLSVSEQVVVSVALARKLGYHVGDNSVAGDDMGEWNAND